MTQSFDFIQVEREGHVSTITIRRPEVLNALHPPACLEMCTALDDFESDPESWVAILTGEGDRSFCSGDDLGWTATHGREAQVAAFRDLLPRGGFGGMTHRITRKPMIAALNGTAVGGGLEIALNCDVMLAVEHAKLGLVEGRVGYIAAGGGVAWLVRKIPHNIAMGMILTGELIGAVEAQYWGLINEVVVEGEVLEAAKRWADKICKTAPLSHRAAKEIAHFGATNAPETLRPFPGLDNSEERFPATIAAMCSEDAMEGPLAFMQKRSPVWKGR